MAVDFKSLLKHVRDYDRKHYEDYKRHGPQYTKPNG